MYSNIRLTEREKEIISLIKEMPTLKQLAEKLGISYRTLQWHLSRLYAKFRVQNKFELILALVDMLPEFKLR